MTGKIFEIKSFAVHDGDGIRTTVFLKGCPLKCIWCHNPEGISFKNQLAYYVHKCISCGECVSVCPEAAHKMSDNRHLFDRKKCIACVKCADACLGDALKFYGTDISTDELLAKLLEDRDFYETSNGGVTLSGGECLMQADFCRELLMKLKENKIHTAVDTCGYVAKESVDKVLPYTDIFLYDIKSYDEDVHIKCTGVSNKIILENLKYIDRLGKKSEIRIPYVPGCNDNQIEKIAGFLKSLNNVTKVRVLPFHNYAGSKYESLAMENKMPSAIPLDDEIQRAEKMFEF